MIDISVVIPARNEIYLQNTIDDIFNKAKTNIEVIVTLDGYWPNPMINDRKNLILIHNTKSIGLRNAVNSMVDIANGKYIMKVDGHCMFAEEFDIDLLRNMQDGYIMIPSRYSLNAEKWERGYGPIEYLFITYPYSKDDQFGEGLHGKKWIGKNGLEHSNRPSFYYYLEREREDKKIDDVQSFQGSCWFMNKQKFIDIGGFSSDFGISVFQEAQEIGFKVWMSGGRIVINKHTWYAHWHKDKSGNYGISNNYKHRVARYSTWYWMNDKWPLAIRKMEDFINFHWPIPGWPENWKKEKEIFEKEHENFYKEL